MKKMIISPLKCWASSSWSWWCWPAGLSSCWLGESSHQSWFSQLATPPLTLCWTSLFLLFVIIIISYGGQHRKLVGWKVGHTSVIGNWAQNNVVEGHHDKKTMLRNKKMWKMHKDMPQNSGDVAILWGLSLKGERVLKVAIFHPNPFNYSKGLLYFHQRFLHYSSLCFTFLLKLPDFYTARPERPLSSIFGSVRYTIF